MKKNFKIFPALFIINSNTGNGLPAVKKTGLNADEKELDFSKGYPQTYRGNCLYNAERTLVTMHFNHADLRSFALVNLPEAIFTKLEPTIRVGKNYTLTYVCVNN